MNQRKHSARTKAFDFSRCASLDASGLQVEFAGDRKALGVHESEDDADKANAAGDPGAVA